MFHPSHRLFLEAAAYLCHRIICLIVLIFAFQDINKIFTLNFKMKLTFFQREKYLRWDLLCPYSKHDILIRISSISPFSRPIDANVDFMLIRMHRSALILLQNSALYSDMTFCRKSYYSRCERFYRLLASVC